MEATAECPTSAGYAYHTTHRENTENILTEGVQCDNSPSYGSSDIIEVLNELGYTDPFPFNRSEVVYCHVDADYVTGTLQSAEESGLASNDVALVVDVDAIDSPMYTADMSIITDLIDYRYSGASVMMHADTPDEVVTNYRESISQVEGTADIKQERSEHVHTELIIDGSIPPGAIVGFYDPAE